MKKKILIPIIAFAIVVISALVILLAVLPGAQQSAADLPTINGVSLSEFVIVYDEQGLDYNKRAAEHIKNTVKQRFNHEMNIIDDDLGAQTHEIVVGETNRPISSTLNEDTSDLEYAILAENGSVALEGDFFVIAAAAYYFTETYLANEGQASAIPEEARVYEPIVKEAKNFILLIGGGMGVYQTKLFEYLDTVPEYSDGERAFYGYMLPYEGRSRTRSLSGITDSAAGGTALSCGYKTNNGYIGKDKDLNDLKSLTELASELGMGAAVMSTESKTGATPASFFAHADSRNDSSEIITGAAEATLNYGTVVDCGFDYYTSKHMATIDKHIDETLGKVAKNENGFFFMYEEAYIDKHCHDNNMQKTFNALVRFNQAIARFMEFAFYNPDTFVLVTADHETGELVPEDDGALAYHSEEHSLADVPVFAYGCGAELFDGISVENIQIAHTIAALMGVDDFGDQSEYTSLTK